MRNSNTMGKLEYILEHIFWGGLSVLCFRRLLFRSIQGHTLLESKLVLWGLLLSFVLFGILITFSRRRNNISMLVNLLVPYEAYLLVTYYHDMTTFIVIIIAIALVLSIKYFFMIVSPEIKNKKMKSLILRKRAEFGLLGARTISAICLMAIVIPLGLSAVFGNSLAFNKKTADVPSDEYECTIANNIDIVSNLRQEVWETLSLAQKAATLQTICNIEAFYLGLPHELNLAIVTIPNARTIAQYNDSTHTVALNIDYLDSMEAEEILDSVCHETFHAYQHRLVDAYESVSDDYKDLLTFHNANKYKDEFSSYIDGDDDPLGYYFQSCESTARVYAADAVNDYYSKIILYANESNGQEGNNNEDELA